MVKTIYHKVRKYMPIFDTITKENLLDIVSLSVNYKTILESLEIPVNNHNRKHLQELLDKYNINIRKAPSCLLNITDEEFTQYWYDSISYAQVASLIQKTYEEYNLESIPLPKNRVVKNYAKNLNLSDDHMLGQSHARGKTFDNRHHKSLEEVMIEDSNYSSLSLKKRLIKEGVLDYKCVWCGNEGIWNEKEVTLQMDHINGNRSDQRLDNLRILCPTCHSYTATFRGRNMKINRTVENIEKEEIIIDFSQESVFETINTKCNKCGDETKNDHLFCSDCEIKVIKEYVEKVNSEKSKKVKKVVKDDTKQTRRSKRKKFCVGCKKPISSQNKNFCIDCYNNHKAKSVPLKNELIDTLIKYNFNFTKIGNFYQVSDNTVRKWCKKYNMPIKKKELQEFIEKHQDI